MPIESVWPTKTPYLAEQYGRPAANETPLATNDNSLHQAAPLSTDGLVSASLKNMESFPQLSGGENRQIETNHHDWLLQSPPNWVVSIIPYIYPKKKKTFPEGGTPVI